MFSVDNLLFPCHKSSLQRAEHCAPRALAAVVASEQPAADGFFCGQVCSCAKALHSLVHRRLRPFGVLLGYGADPWKVFLCAQRQAFLPPPTQKKPASPKRNGFHASAAREQQAGYGAVTKRLPRCHSRAVRAAPDSPSPLPVGGCLLLAGHCGVRGAGAAGCGVRHCPGWSQSMPPALPMPLP